MTNPPVNSVSGIQTIREKIDQVDHDLLALIAARLELALSVRHVKSGVRIWRPSREESHVRDLATMTRDGSALLVSRIWAELMSASLALQGSMRLHIALEGDAMDVWSLVRDRFGAALPAQTYPTASAALATAYEESEGVAILPAPGGLNQWWSALCPDGAISDMHILVGLPRVREADRGNQLWPRAVAVASADILPSGRDESLIVVQKPDVLTEFPAQLMGRSGGYALYRLPIYLDAQSDIFRQIQAHDSKAKIIGCLPHPLE